MEVDHLFVFSNRQGREADELVAFGLAEGSNRIHLGQGTCNRKLYFENRFLLTSEDLTRINSVEKGFQPNRESLLTPATINTIWIFSKKK